MIVYNISAEYAALIIISAILFSFSRTHDTETVEYRFIKTMYWVTLFNGFVTIAAIISGAPGEGTLHMTVAWLCNILYFVCLPSISLCFLIYAKLVTVLKFDRNGYRKKLLPVFVPYLIYLVVLTYALASGKVFHMDTLVGYVRGPWYQIPYVIVAVNLVYAAIIITKNLSLLHRGLRRTILATTLLAFFFLYVQFMSGNTILTGIIHTSCILSLHLHALNVKKDTDSMTGVYNRVHLISNLRALTDKKEPFSLYVFSLRGMKTINERHGIEYGDRVLMRVAQIFTTHCQDSTIFRYSGDEFALLLDDSQKNHYALVASIVNELDTIQVIDENEVDLDFVYTRVDYDLFGENARALISAVDYSISSLKEQDNGHRYLYDTAVVQALIRRSEMIQQIKDALEGDAFEVHYQPIYCQEKGTFTQAEALVRMRNYEGYLVYPGDFIDLAVKTGLIVPITYLILDQVCTDLRYMLDRHGEGFSMEAISVNFPYLQFTDSHMQEKVKEILDRHQIPPSMIKIEITEREMIADTVSTSQIMSEMEKAGFRFELDDFGMDYSNMSVVLGLPLESVKLDRSFLLSAFESEANKYFFRHLVQGILGIGSNIICEGVESQEQLDFATSCGCQYIQGYFFSKPLNRDMLQNFLNSYPTEP